MKPRRCWQRSIGSPWRTGRAPPCRSAPPVMAKGGLIALYAAALDMRIDAALVSGYFESRQNLWQEPIYRNVFGLLREFGDAEIASLIAPRSLIIEHSQGPSVSGPPKADSQRRRCAAPRSTRAARLFLRTRGSRTCPTIVHGPNPTNRPRRARRRPGWSNHRARLDGSVEDFPAASWCPEHCARNAWPFPRRQPVKPRSCRAPTSTGERVGRALATSIALRRDRPQPFLGPGQTDVR